MPVTLFSEREDSLFDDASLIVDHLQAVVGRLSHLRYALAHALALQVDALRRRNDTGAARLRRPSPT